ncbi:MAG: SDR family oxidoreductase [Novosphingobium sp.]
MAGPFDLSGKRALVTGAGQGIGRACAEALRDAGAAVLAADHRTDTLETLSDCMTARLEVRDKAAVTELAAREGAFDVLVNCVGMVHGGRLLECTEQDLAEAFDLNVMAMFRLTRALMPAMLANGGGSIVNIASVAGSIIGVPNRFAYGTTKAAVIGLTKAIAVDYVKEGIRCNAICPGTIHSPSLEQRLAATGDFEAAMAEFITRQPIGRIGKPEEVAAIAVWLASDAAAFVTGQCHIIDGGWTNA